MALNDTHGQAGLAVVLILFIMVMPAILGAVLGAGLGRLIVYIVQRLV
jgi:hypothetical protein